MIHVSAPGKLMLFGDHAVIYGRPCIVTAVNQRMHVHAERLNNSQLHVEAPDVHISNYKKSLADLGKGDIPKGAMFVEIAVRNIFEKYHITSGIKITTSSEFSSQFGFGSSSATTVCVIKAVSALCSLQLTHKDIFDLAYKTVLDIQGNGSGFDIAAAVYGGTLYYVRGGKILEPLDITALPLLVGYSRIKADTITVMKEVKERFANDQEKVEHIYTAIGQIVEKAKDVLLKKDFISAGKLMNDNQTYLQQLGVSIPKLNTMITASLEAGAYGAKLSGAGGGDCMISLVPENKKSDVEEAVEKSGGQVLSAMPNAEGVRIE